MVIVVVGQVAYHATMRGADPNGSVFELVAIAYVVALCTTVILGLALGQLSWPEAHSATLGRGLALGLAVSAVEIGYVYAYRRGLPVSTGALGVLGLTTLALIPIGVVIFREHISLRMLLGAVIAMFGLWLTKV